MSRSVHGNVVLRYANGQIIANVLVDFRGRCEESSTATLPLSLRPRRAVKFRERRLTDVGKKQKKEKYE